MSTTAARIRSLDPLAPAKSGRSENPMKTSGIEELKSVLRRSSMLILAVVLAGVVGMNVIRQVSGPQYRAHARVLLNNNDNDDIF